ncbi:MAG: 3-dehydroquinate dehydratase [Prevotella sp.]|nr:3-dehydroquinate dehydratase [Prevotella sp.]MCM1075388.1 3-dehydroquinate dehydratase [Ruminococcus sp.]
MTIAIINGPNLNLLGSREPHIYGTVTFEEYLSHLSDIFPHIKFIYSQSNCEGDIIDELHNAGRGDSELRANAVVLNAGAYTHYSYAIADAIKAIEPLPVIEVHISQPAAREEFRHKSVIAPVCKASVSGFGLASYELAIKGLSNILHDS